MKPRLVAQSFDSYMTPASDVISTSQCSDDVVSGNTLQTADTAATNASDVTLRPEAEVNDKMTYECRMSSCSDDVFTACIGDKVTCKDDVHATQLSISDESLTTDGETFYVIIKICFRPAKISVIYIYI